jgi:hypothetical protein
MSDQPVESTVEDTVGEQPEAIQISHIGLSVPLVQAVVSYLGQRPYAEVRDLVNAIERESQASVQAQVAAREAG